MNETNFSLFNEIEKKLQEQKSKNTESIIESKLTERNQKFSKKSTIEDFREDKQETEINLRRVTREDKFDQFRRQQQLIIDNSLALKNIIKLPMNIFEDANKLEVKV